MDSTRNTTTERAYPRVSKLLFVSFITTEQGEQKTPISMGRALNISETGLGIEVFQEIAVKSTMELDIDLEETTISLTGTVVHTQPLGDGKFYVGIRFDEPHEELRQKVAELL